ncbi:MAG: hypothetical protein IT384_10395 [Deltaproteobacteria bacterium]|nr:hypothetical protein [Deltaproteobacteria bacterium]
MVAKLTEPLPATLTREQAEALVRDYGPSAGIVDERGIAAALSRFDGDPAPRSLPEACAVAITLDCARFAGVDPKALSRKALELEVRRSRRQPSAG